MVSLLQPVGSRRTAVAQHAVPSAPADLRAECVTGDRLDARRSRRKRTIAGDVLVPFMTQGYEGFDINDPYDWLMAERLLADGTVTLPRVAQEPYGAVRA
jgi:hypothetical protein